MPKRRVRNNCIPELILDSDGKERVVMLDQIYRPYEEAKPTIENLCGSFQERVDTETLTGVTVNTNSLFGRQKEAFCIHGNIVINAGKASFMGVRNVDSLQKLAESIGLSSAGNSVHMAVMCAKIGRRMQVKACGLLENRLLTHFNKNIRVEQRLYENTNAVKISIKKFTAPPRKAHESAGDAFALDKRFRPDKNIWTITGRGTVMARFSWESVEWTKECEEACLALCKRVIAQCISMK
jgi:hypothetical protein